MSDVVVVDYGIGNLKSVQRGLEKVGAKVVLSAEPGVITQASHLVLPGVGAFEDGMKGLSSAGVLDAIRIFADTGNPMMGICLGMQMLLDGSEEYGKYQGLGLIPGVVKAIPREDHKQKIPVRKIPHIGWSALKPVGGGWQWEDSCLSGNHIGDFVYFVHSFMAMPEEQSLMLAQCEYEGLLVMAAVKYNNITGLQFHPEKSGIVGLKVLEAFVKE